MAGYPTIKYYPRETAGFISANTHTHVFIAGLILVAQRNTLHLSLPETWINHAISMLWISAQCWTLIHATLWINFKVISPDGRSQSMHCAVVFAYNPGTFQIMISEEVDPQSLGMGWVGWGQGEEKGREEGLMKTWEYLPALHCLLSQLFQGLLVVSMSEPTKLCTVCVVCYMWIKTPQRSSHSIFCFS